MILPALTLVLVSSIISFPLEPNRIINGQEAEEGQFPWQAQLTVRVPENLIQICGASIISDNWILSAAHCVYGALAIDIYIGSLVLNNGTKYPWSEFYPHENYTPSVIGLRDDVSVTKLTNPLKFTDNIQFIFLSPTVVGGGLNVTISGWGSTKTTTEVSQVLNFVNLRTISREECEDTYGNIIYDGFICTLSIDSSDAGICGGDSGSALVVLDSPPVQIALVSFRHAEGCELGYPSGYTQVGYFRDWIEEKTGV